MPASTIKLNGREFTSGSGVITIGRTPDNDVSFPGDSNVSRYHAEIEIDHGHYRLIDLKSSNGTTLNGNSVSSGVDLSDGDKIVLGGSSDIAVAIRKPGDEKPAQAQVETQAVTNAPSVSVPPVSHAASALPDAEITSSSFRPILLIGAVCVVAVLLVAGAGAAYYLTRGPSCDATIKIVSPEAGETIIEAATIEVDVSNSSCVGRVIYTIDGIEFAVKEEQPFDAAIDPKEFPELADGFDHSLAVMLEDLDGNPLGQPSPILLAFETREISKPPANTDIADAEPQPKQPDQPKGKEVSLIEVQDMAKRLVKQFSGNYAYNVSNKQFLQEIQKKTAEYAQEGYFERASRYRDPINVAYAREQNLDAALGFMLAMSRSRFNPEKQGSDEGLWRMSNAFVTSNAYNGLCGTETLSDPSQNCAAKASALYMKAIVFGVFDGDMIYSAAAFGKSPQDAGAWKASLPANRSDLWNSIKSVPEREQLIRFFAAGIVAENPQKFGLKKDRPLSELYRLTM